MKYLYFVWIYNNHDTKQRRNTFRILIGWKQTELWVYESIENI